MLERSQVEKYLEIIKGIKKSHELIDIHVHPFDVMSNGFMYTRNGQYDDIYSVNSSQYVAPNIGQLKISGTSNEKLQEVSSDLRAKMALLTARRLYAHTGPRMFGDHMELSGIDKSVLLPVMRADESNDKQIKILYSMFGDDERFDFGYCISNSIPNSEIKNVVKEAIKKYKIKVIKIHPNITGIDLFSGSGKERIEYILGASRDEKLSVIVHGGRSTGLLDSKAAVYSTLNNLQHINWGITNEAVVIAHAGIYGYHITRIENEVIPLMNKMLSQYDNLLVDISGLNVDEICAILRNIDLERILFGSDALYNMQWHATVKLLYALEKTTSDYEESFTKIVSLNPGQFINTTKAESYV